MQTRHFMPALCLVLSALSACQTPPGDTEGGDGELNVGPCFVNPKRCASEPGTTCRELKVRQTDGKLVMTAHCIPIPSFQIRPEGCRAENVCDCVGLTCPGDQLCKPFN